MSEPVSALHLPGLVGPAAGQVASALVTAPRQRRERARALVGRARTADLLEAEPDLKALTCCPHLLAWGISRLPLKEVGGAGRPAGHLVRTQATGTGTPSGCCSVW
ncbi:hypothetical protein [Streptomyces sp. NPDC054783]